MQKMLFIFNPNTGGGRLRSRLMEILCYFASQDYQLTVCPTGAQGDARLFAFERAMGHDIVVCCGGDGTLNEVVDGLGSLENPPLLGYIPGGTTNDFASSLKLPKSNMLSAAKRAVHPKKILDIDVGRINDRSFTYVAAFGAFTDVSYSTPQAFKNIFGYFAYIVEGIQKLPGLQPSHVRLEANGKVYEEDFLFGMVSNSTSVGGFSFLAQEEVHMDDGLFEVLMVRPPQNLSDLRSVSSALLSHDTASAWILSLQVPKLTISSQEALPWTLDGEYGGEIKKAEIHVRPKALRMCV